MPIAFLCPNCRIRIQVDDAWDGGRVTCGVCRASLKVPAGRRLKKAPPAIPVAQGVAAPPPVPELVLDEVPPPDEVPAVLPVPQRRQRPRPSRWRPLPRRRSVAAQVVQALRIALWALCGLWLAVLLLDFTGFLGRNQGTPAIVVGSSAVVYCVWLLVGFFGCYCVDKVLCAAVGQR